jgi:hypothetical protein
MFTVDGKAIAHFLVDDGQAARRALAAAGLTVTAVREVSPAALTRKPTANSARSPAPSPRRVRLPPDPPTFYAATWSTAAARSRLRTAAPAPGSGCAR